DKTQWYHEGVDFVLDNGLMKGMSDTIFAPNGEVTRAQLVTILYRLEGQPSIEGLENPFEDIAEKDWFYDAVVWAASEGVVNGTSATTFDPNAAITREQIAAILFRYAGAEAIEEDHLKDFTDADKISAYAVDAMNWAVANGLIKGLTDTTVAPRATATRAQIATILMRYCN
ncbi:MAG: S-layer homology domain-containing protein, partial [Oscillospiraceae bacterium]|nr:S-layer homology domain-containing protein [Oscillospiraceae bacterium]